MCLITIVGAKNNDSRFVFSRVVTASCGVRSFIAKSDRPRIRGLANTLRECQPHCRPASPRFVHGKDHVNKTSSSLTMETSADCSVFSLSQSDICRLCGIGYTSGFSIYEKADAAELTIADLINRYLPIQVSVFTSNRRVTPRRKNVHCMEMVAV